MATKGFRVAANVLAFIASTDAATKAKNAHEPGEEPRVTLVRHLLSLPRRSDGSVWVAGLTAGELDQLAEEAQRLVKAATGAKAATPEKRGQLLAARAVMRACGTLRTDAPTTSVIGAPADAEPEPIEVDPLVERLRLAEEEYNRTREAHESATKARQKILDERNAKIVKLASATPRHSNEEIGQMFDLHPSQVSRIKGAQATRKK